MIKLLFALLLFLVALASGLYPLSRKRKGHNIEFPVGESLACGIFLGAALIHLLSEASAEFALLHIQYPLASVLAGATFLLFLWLEHVGREFNHLNPKPTNYLALLAVIMLSIHALLEGAALGLSEAMPVMLLLFIAILSHKWAASFSMAIFLNKSALSEKEKRAAFLLFASMTPIGILMGRYIMLHLSHRSWLAPICISMAAGTFLYLGTLHGLERGTLVKQCCNLKNFSFVIFGFLLMALLALYS